jgi:transposase
MLRGGDVNEITELRRQGLSVTQIGTLTGFDRKTIRKYLDDPQRPRYGPRPERGSQLEPFTTYLHERLSAGVWNAVVLLAELKARGYEGSYTVLKDYLRPLRREAAAVAVRRFETPPGQQAQLDWGTIGRLETAAASKALHVFVLTLGHSRAMFADVTTDTQLQTLLRMHEAAFAELGGVPHEILYDRMKTVILGLDGRNEIKWNPQFVDFAGYWGFTPRACAAYRPQTKGKVENGIGYVRKNFLCGRQSHDLADLRGQLRTWVWQVANQRQHGTTHRHVLTAWQEEKRLLWPLAGRASYPHIGQETRRVSRDAYISFRGNRYSVPWRVAGQEVLLQEVGTQLEIARGGERLAVHALCAPGAHQTITITAHHAGIPLVLAGTTGKAKIVLPGAALDAAASAVGVPTLPMVEVRPLWAYEQSGEQSDSAEPYELGDDEPGYAALPEPAQIGKLEVQHG